MTCHLKRPETQSRLVTVLGAGHGTLSPHTGDRQRDAAILIEEEHQRLTAAQLYFVTDDMTRLVTTAAQTLPVHTFNPHDVPAAEGFMVFAEPIGTYLSGPQLDEVVKIVACSWGRSEFSLGDDGVWLTFWSLTNVEAASATLRSHGLSPRQALRRALDGLAELTWDNEVTMGYGPQSVAVLGNRPRAVDLLRSFDLDGDSDWEKIHDLTVAWGHTVRAAWLLMTQEGVTAVDELRTIPAASSGAARPYAPPPAVRVVRVRHREDSPIPAEPQPRGYRVRWVVRGHWRNQWYPSRQEHRPVWINPYIKGPDGAPLHTGQTVHLLDAPKQE